VGGTLDGCSCVDEEIKLLLQGALSGRLNDLVSVKRRLKKKKLTWK